MSDAPTPFEMVKGKETCWADSRCEEVLKEQGWKRKAEKKSAKKDDAEDGE